MTCSRINGEDRVIEHGKSGIWWYRKWESGVVEAWGYVVETVNPGDYEAWGDGYLASNVFGRQTYPVTFTDIYSVQASLSTSGGGTAILVLDGTLSGNSTCTYGLSRNTIPPASGTYKLYISVVGKV